MRNLAVVLGCCSLVVFVLLVLLLLLLSPPLPAAPSPSPEEVSTDARGFLLSRSCTGSSSSSSSALFSGDFVSPSAPSFVSSSAARLRDAGAEGGRELILLSVLLRAREVGSSPVRWFRLLLLARSCRPRPHSSCLLWHCCCCCSGDSSYACLLLGLLACMVC